MNWTMLHPEATPDMLGYLPGFLSEKDPDKAREQLNKNYSHGGGWFPMKRFTKLPDGRLKYPGDPPLLPLAQTKLRDELIVLYEHEVVAIIQPDGSFEAARMD